MSSLRMKIAALASVAGLGALGGYALNSNTGVCDPDPGRLDAEAEAQGEDAGDAPDGSCQAEAEARCGCKRSSGRNLGRRGPAAGSRRGAVPGAGADEQPRSSRSQAVPHRARAHLSRSRHTPAAAEVAVATAVRSPPTRRSRRWRRRRRARA